MMMEERSIKTIFIEYSDLSDEAIAPLIDGLLLNPQLQLARLRGNNLTCEGAKIISSLILNHSQIKEIDISHNRISDAGAIAIAESIANSLSLRTLVFDNAIFGDKAAEALVQASIACPTMRSLSMRSDHIATEGRYAVAYAQATQSTLKIHGVDPTFAEQIHATRFAQQARKR